MEENLKLLIENQNVIIQQQSEILKKLELVNHMLSYICIIVIALVIYFIVRKLFQYISSTIRFNERW